MARKIWRVGKGEEEYGEGIANCELRIARGRRREGKGRVGGAEIP